MRLHSRSSKSVDWRRRISSRLSDGAPRDRSGPRSAADGVQPEAKETKPQRTHWDMLRERRSIPELEEILAERLEQLRKEQ